MDRQRILLIFGGAWISAALLTWFVYSRTAGASGKTTPVVAASRDLGAGSRLRKTDIRIVHVSSDTVPNGALVDPNVALDRVLLFPVAANEPLVSGKLTRIAGGEGVSAIIQPGKRAVSVSITEMSSAGGLIQPRSHVDVLFTRSGTMREALTSTILQNVVVLAIGRTTEVASSDSRSGSSSASAPRAAGQTQAATLLVTPEEAKRLELAKNQGKISLALRNPLDSSFEPVMEPARADVLDPYIGRPPRPQTAFRGPNVRDPQVWAQVTGMEAPVSSKPKTATPAEAPKPRHVVDVFHGDKHVQEIFQ